LELRTTPRQLKVDPPSKSRGSPYKGRSRSLSNSEKEKAAGDTWLLPGGIEAYVDIILEEMERWEGDAAADPVEQRLIPRLLISIDRAAGYEAAEASVELACDLFTSGNRFVVGVEIGGNPMKGDFATFVPLLEKARDIGLKVSVHCAEVPASVKDEMEEIINFRPDRLGHALFLPEACVKMLESDPIPIEACPTSNVMTLELAQPGGGGSGGGEDDSEAVGESWGVGGGGAGREGGGGGGSEKAPSKGRGRRSLALLSLSREGERKRRLRKRGWRSLALPQSFARQKRRHRKRRRRSRFPRSFALVLASHPPPSPPAPRSLAVEGLKKHPTLKHWLDTGYPISISTDDSGVFNTDSTNELVVLCNAFGLDEWLITGLVWASLDVSSPSQPDCTRRRVAHPIDLTLSLSLPALASRSHSTSSSRTGASGRGSPATSASPSSGC
jgi:adenosine deaminase